MRSHSMGSKGRQNSRDFHPRHRADDGETAADEQEAAQLSAESRAVAQLPIASQDGHVSDSNSTRLSQPLAYRSRYTGREGVGPNAIPNPTSPSPGQGSLSSTGVGSTSGSWSRSRTRPQNPSRYELRSGIDDDDDALDLPFAMDASTR